MRRGIYELAEKDSKVSEKKVEVFVYEILELAEKEGFTVQEVKKITERMERYIHIAEYSMMNNTKYNAPGCYLR